MPHSLGLDLLRVLALCLVLFAHGCVFWLPRFTELLAFPARICSFIGIEIFFVLSGFLIARALFSISETRQGVMKFWLRRALRILPGYYFLLLINMAVMGWLLGRPMGDASYIWFGQNLFAPMRVFFYPESWSLALEVWFYLLAPVFVWLLPSLRTRLGIVVGWISALLLLVFFALLRVRAAEAGASWDEGLRKIVLLRLDALVFGVVAGGFAIYRPDACQKAQKLVLFAVILFAALVQWMWINHSVPGVGFRALSFSLCGLAAALLLPYFACWRSGSALLRSWLTRFSRWSYAIYLTHLLVLFVVLHYGGVSADSSVWRMASLTGIWLVSSLLLAMAVYRWIEKPLMPASSGS